MSHPYFRHIDRWPRVLPPYFVWLFIGVLAGAMAFTAAMIAWFGKL